MLHMRILVLTYKHTILLLFHLRVRETLHSPVKKGCREGRRKMQRTFKLKTTPNNIRVMFSQKWVVFISIFQVLIYHILNCSVFDRPYFHLTKNIYPMRLLNCLMTISYCNHGYFICQNNSFWLLKSFLFHQVYLSMGKKKH